MKIIKEFPAQYQNINIYVESIEIPNSHFGDGGNEDFFVRFKDGRLYLFVAFTPENLRELMNVENVKSFIAPALLVVDKIDISSLIEAIEECLMLSSDMIVGLDHFGVLQI